MSLSMRLGYLSILLSMVVATLTRHHLNFASYRFLLLPLTISRIMLLYCHSTFNTVDERSSASTYSFPTQFILDWREWANNDHQNSENLANAKKMFGSFFHPYKSQRSFRWCNEYWNHRWDHYSYQQTRHKWHIHTTLAPWLLDESVNDSVRLICFVSLFGHIWIQNYIDSNFVLSIRLN